MSIPPQGAERAEPWWREGVLYQIYPRSFADANGDGIGDLPGIVGKLDYLAWLGVDGIWINPINPSPNVDWGYDVTDYTGVHPELGTLADVDRLVAEAGRRGIHSMSRPEAHEILRDWRRLAETYEPSRVLVGEAYVLDIPAWARFYGSGADELNLAFNFALAHAELDAGEMRSIVAATEAAL